MKYPNRLREWRKKRGLKLHELADLYSQHAPEGEESTYSLQHIGRIETGEKKLYMHVAEAFARALGVDTSQLLPSDHMNVNIVGRIGAGAQVIPYDDFAKGDGFDSVKCPPGLDPMKTVAVEVTGDSMSPMIQNGWLVFYSRDPESDAAAVIGKTCVVKLDDGRMLLKQVRRGYSPGKFNLLSVNAPMIEDAELEWASPVRVIMPPDLVDHHDNYSTVDSGENHADELLANVTREVEASLKNQGIRLSDAKKDEIILDVYEKVKAGNARAAKAGKAVARSIKPTNRKNTPLRRS